jgi:hypothetical protein
MKRWFGVSSFILLLAFWVAPWRLLVHAQAVHSVTLSWTASTSVGVTYNVYRSVTSGVYVNPLNSTAVNSLTYIDTAGLVEGQKYFYVVRSKSTVESANSNEVFAVIPVTAPNPPTGVQVVVN